MRRIAIINQKGGVGKTTTAVNLSACLAEKDYRVLLFDLDPQANATMATGHTPHELQHTLYSVLRGVTPLTDVVIDTQVSGLQVVPANMDLSEADISFAGHLARPYLLRNALRQLSNGDQRSYDFLIFDSPPNLGLLTLNALLAATEMIIPVDSQYHALAGMSALLKMVAEVAQQLDHKVTLLGILMTMFEKNTTLNNAIRDQVIELYGEKVLQTIIPKNITLGEANLEGMPVIRWAPRSPGAQQYRALADEVLAMGDRIAN
jgi:chromosome partitioning protein